MIKNNPIIAVLGYFLRPHGYCKKCGKRGTFVGACGDGYLYYCRKCKEYFITNEIE